MPGSKMGESSTGVNSFKLCRGQKITATWKLQNVSKMAEDWLEDRVTYKDDHDDSEEAYFKLDYVPIPEKDAKKVNGVEDDDSDQDEDEYDDEDRAKAKKEIHSDSDEYDDEEAEASESDDEDDDDGNSSKRSTIVSDGSDDDDDDEQDNDRVDENSDFFMDIDTGRAKGRLRLYLRKHSAPEKGGNYRRWLSLNVEQLSNEDNLIVQYHFQVEAKLQEGEDDSTEKSFHSKQVFIQDDDDDDQAKATLKKKIVQLQSRRKRSNANGSGQMPAGDLLLEISVTPIYISSSSPAPTSTQPKTKNDFQAAYLKELKNLLLLPGEQTQADLQLETKDGKKYSAHKCILAVRCPVLLELLLNNQQSAEGGSTIKLTFLSGEPMWLILWWIYTSELILKESLIKYLGEVVKTVEDWKLNDLLKALDTNLKNICNERTMIPMYRAIQGKKDKLPNAFKNVAKFVSGVFEELGIKQENGTST